MAFDEPFHNGCEREFIGIQRTDSTTCRVAKPGDVKEPGDIFARIKAGLRKGKSLAIRMVMQG